VENKAIRSIFVDSEKMWYVYYEDGCDLFNLAFYKDLLESAKMTKHPNPTNKNNIKLLDLYLSRNPNTQNPIEKIKAKISWPLN